VGAGGGRQQGVIRDGKNGAGSTGGGFNGSKSKPPAKPKPPASADSEADESPAGGPGSEAPEVERERSPQIAKMDVENPPERMGGFTRVYHPRPPIGHSTSTDQLELLKPLLECAEAFFQPHIGCSCVACHKRKTRDRLSEAISEMKSAALRMREGEA
jgi:hypothetical protein